MANKIKYNLKNVHVALQHKSTTGYTYETPAAVPGAVSMSLDAEGTSSPFYADGIVYFRSAANNGYSGDLEIALIPEWFRETILQEAKDTNNVFIETSDPKETAYFALLFEFDGDEKAIRHVLYNCLVSARPTIASQTKESSIEPGTEKLSLSVDPREDGLVKARTGDDTNSGVYLNWYSAVYTPVVSAGSESGSGSGTGSETGSSTGSGSESDESGSGSESSESGTGNE